MQKTKFRRILSVILCVVLIAAAALFTNGCTDEKTPEATEKAATASDSINIENNISLIAVVGRKMRNAHGTAARVFNSLAKAGINIRLIDQGSSELNIIIGVDTKDFEGAIKAIYSEFVK